MGTTQDFAVAVAGGRDHRAHRHAACTLMQVSPRQTLQGIGR